MKPSRILIADDHAVVRDGLRMILESSEDLVVVGAAGDGRDALVKSEELRPQVILMDIGMPLLNGIEATRMICSRLPAVKVIILSMHNTREHLHRALQAGAFGYLLKESAGQEVVAAVRTVLKGRRFFGSGVEERSGREWPGARKSPLERLSPREREVLQLVAEGKTSAEIGHLLSLSPKSVETYRSRLMRKLDVPNLPALVRFSLQHGITPAS